MNRFASHRRAARALLALGTLFVLTATGSANAAPVLIENFDDINTLSASGWTLINQSDPAGVTNWFQGAPGVFSAQSGAADSYIAANFNGAAFEGVISEWLISPVLTLQNDDVLTFFTRTDEPAFGDQLEVRLSAAGAGSTTGTTATSVGDFTNLLLVLNSTSPTAAPYPAEWTQYSVNISGLAAPTAARFAFRYVVDDTSVNGDYIGIDSVALSSVPEPSTLALSVVGLFAGARAWRRHGVRRA